MKLYLWFIPLAGLLLTACGTTPPSRYYVLNGAVPGPSTEQTVGHQTQAAKALNIGLAGIALPGYLDQNRLVRRTGSNTLSVEQFDRWTEPLDEGVQRVLAANLADLLDARVHPLPWPRGMTQDYQVITQVAQFDADEQGSVILAGTWSLREGRDGTSPERHVYRVEVPSYGEDNAAVAAAMSAALQKLSSQMAEVISLRAGLAQSHQ